MKGFVYSLAILSSIAAYAGPAPSGTVAGVIKSFDAETVVLDSHGMKVVVPRKSIRPPEKVEVGKRVVVEVPGPLIRPGKDPKKNQ